MTMLCSRPSFRRKNVTPAKTGAGIQAPGPPASGCRITSGMMRAEWQVVRQFENFQSIETTAYISK